jgi:hypothetical protein
LPQRSSDNSSGVSALRDHLHRYWFTFDEPPKASFFGLGCGVTAVDREGRRAAASFRLVFC